MPFKPVNDILSQSTFADACGVSGIGADGRCRSSSRGASGGKVPDVHRSSTKGSRGYNTDWNNFAPNVGVAWRPNVQGGWLRALLGDPEQATLRARLLGAYNRQGMGIFTGQYGANPGSTLSLTRSEANGLLVPAGGQSWPVLCCSAADRRPCPPASSRRLHPRSPVSDPVRSNRADSINIFHPDIQIAYARSWTVSLQRALSRTRRSTSATSARAA